MAKGTPKKKTKTGFEQIILKSDSGDISVLKLAKKIERAKTESLKNTLFLSVFREDRINLLQHIILSMPSGKYLLKREGFASPSLEREIMNKYGTHAGTNDIKKIIRGLATTHPNRVSANFTLGIDELTLKPTTTKATTEVPAVRLIEIPKTKRASVTGLKSIKSGEVNLEESKEFVIGENAGWVAADRLSRNFPVSEEGFAIADFINKAHFEPYAPNIPLYIKNGTEEQSRSYGMGFDVGVRDAINRGLGATLKTVKSPTSKSPKAISSKPNITKGRVLITPKRPIIK